MRRSPQQHTFQYVQEFNDDFLKLFPHRYDYLWAPHPRPGDRPEWRTESKHPLSDRLIRECAYLYGVRFGATTNYVLLDVDRSSLYHPVVDRFAIGRMLAALEPIGMCAMVPVTSSRSGGIHVYLPMSEPCKSWEIAAVVTHLLEKAGFTVEEGTLEVLPNPRNYDPDSTTLYKGHRLPLQDGSYILDGDWGITFTTPEHFVHQWRYCTSKNDIHTAALTPILKQARRKYSNLSHKGSKFLNDLNACVDPGWTGHGQTNFILGRIALREYVFGHLIRGVGEPLEGDRLTSAIVATAIELPGYRDYCRHQHEIWKRAEDWARSVEASKYWHWKQPKPQPEVRESEALEAFRISWNEWQQQQARDRLRWAIACLLETGKLPAGARERFRILTTGYHFSGETLYHHRDLWHPEHLWNSPPHPPTGEADERCILPDGGTATHGAPSLFSPSERNANRSEGYRRFLASISDRSGCNTPLDKVFSDSIQSHEAKEDECNRTSTHNNSS
ncbi:MAG: hypothetical protein IGS48_02520 [Oscillatoriales cyanobacterium C42_A2020_001]|nr:hypothetical protein [Leptolyngbyaceae cyanobacterium C42_A2020_001]